MSGVLCTGTHFGEVEFQPVESSFSQAVLGFPSQFYQFGLFFSGFSSLHWVFSVFLGDLDETWSLPPLVSISHSGLLIWMKGVLQGVSGGALWVVR